MKILVIIICMIITFFVAIVRARFYWDARMQKEDIKSWKKKYVPAIIGWILGIIYVIYEIIKY